VSGDEFDFEATRDEWPDHWDHDEKGWPTVGSRWRARLYPQMRVLIVGRSDEYMTVLVYWDGDLEGLRRLFTHEPSERWEIGTGGLVQMPSGIGPWEADGPAGDGRHWRDEWDLTVYFERARFGGPDTWHYGREPFDSLPFFEPIPDPEEA
jgi:hypothetical protein